MSPEVAGAVARGNIHATAEGNGEVRVIAAYAGPVVEGFQRRPRHPRVLVAKSDVPMDVVAYGLDATPSGRRLSEQIPRDLGKAIRFAIPASEQEEQGLFG